MTTIDFDKIFYKLAVGLSEIIALAIGGLITAISGLLLFASRKYVYSFLNAIGVKYFTERHKNIREINSDLIWVQGRFGADCYGLFRTYNGKSYVDNDTIFSATESDSKKLDFKKIKIVKMNSKPESIFPESLDVELYRHIVNETVVNDWKFFTYDSVRANNPNSSLLVFLEANSISNLLTFRIWDKDKRTYGIIFFVWNNDININDLFTKQISRKLDSIAIRFQNHIESSIMERLGLRVNI